MFKNFFFTITLLLLTTLLQDTHACTVQEPPPTTEESYNNHDLVFEGKVIGVDEPQDQSGEKNVTINITRIWKKSDSDEVSVNDPIKIYTAANSPLCGIMPRESESWTIFSGSSRRASNTESVISNKDITDALNELSPPPADDPPVEDPPVEDPPTVKKDVNHVLRIATAAVEDATGGEISAGEVM
eukprot:CAMPEP_0195268138 /NCGR_PEP_ID=MMETSP0706-20130129/12994_1 /TAXON_ID=33640 /ORGANISM="Asterionellopsis glacialis, Strain CCMP134" /LENGTH=185 /DNA_ID=CAMNT_0040322997 /DNA_START=102 /DNA_END=660 /DNA_ORIENTATION=-